VYYWYPDPNLDRFTNMLHVTTSLHQSPCDKFYTRNTFLTLQSVYQTEPIIIVSEFGNQIWDYPVYMYWHHDGIELVTWWSRHM